MRLAGSVLLEIHDEWTVADKRYLSQGSMEKIYQTSKDGVKEKEVEQGKQELPLHRDVAESSGLPLFHHPTGLVPVGVPKPRFL